MKTLLTLALTVALASVSTAWERKPSTTIPTTAATYYLYECDGTPDEYLPALLIAKSPSGKQLWKHQLDRITAIKIAADPTGEFCAIYIGEIRRESDFSATDPNELNTIILLDGATGTEIKRYEPFRGNKALAWVQDSWLDGLKMEFQKAPARGLKLTFTPYSPPKDMDKRMAAIVRERHKNEKAFSMVLPLPKPKPAKM